MKKDLARLTDQITDALNDLKDMTSKQARQRYADARSNADSVASGLYDRGNAMVSDLYDRGNAAVGSAQEYASSIEESLEDAIQTRPLLTVGLALGLGFLIGAAWKK